MASKAQSIAFRRMRALYFCNRQSTQQDKISTGRLIDNVAQGDYKND